MTRITLAGTVAAYLESHPGEQALELLHLACIQAGVNVTLEQVYAGVQSMASTGKCGRGHGKRTYCRLVDADPARVVMRSEPGAVRRVSRAAFYSNDSILAFMTETLGEPIPRPPHDKLFAVLLLGEDSPEFIFERAGIVLKRPPTKWAHWKVGPNVVIGFTVEVPDET